MSHPEIAPSGKHILFRRVGGQRLERWPVDARELLRSRDYVASIDEVVSAEPEGEGVDPSSGPLPFEPLTVSTRALPEALAGVTSLEELRALRAADTRSSVVRLYDAREVQLVEAVEAADPSAEGATGEDSGSEAEAAPAADAEA